ncbi:DNA replication factor Cdt1 C-terminal [Arabidopsis suecica]|uniref:DNA replication factor Cdt1 C-terminal n=1 Tax=Arabidopsis suecica TaxID=45249 RepID=A0A8T2AKH8_ARASU|nr:DNA replication factor Cdt1 C-terminal [Arabidopsis suecica]
MSAPGSSRSIPFKSKKRLVMDSPSSKSQTGNPNPSSVALPTPEKPLENMLSRSRNRSVALSVKEIRQAAGSRRRSEDPVASSAKSKLFFSHNDSPSSSPSKRIISNKNAEKEKLPEKYENLGKFFEALDNSMLLSKLRGSKPTFSNISKQIEHLTERRFCYSHLAQIKHILREAIEIKRVLIHDERTCCMKPDLHITLNADAVEYKDKSKSESKKIALRKVFRARLAEFVKAHPQGDEVPEEPLPEPFNRRKPDENSKVEVKSVSSLMEEIASIPAATLFSSPITSTPVKTSSSPAKPTSSQINIAPTPSKPTSTPAKPTSSEIDIVPTPVKLVSTLAKIPSTPAIIDSTPVIAASTPPEFASTPARLLSTSLAARPLKRSSGHTNPDDTSADPPTKLVRRSLSLNFDSYPEDEKAVDFTDDEPIDQVPEEELSSDDEILSILPDKLRHAIKEQERKAIEDQNPAISLAKRRRKMIACLPKLFNVIHYLIQSIRRWVITKEELVHKIIAGHSDITDRKEVEEQLILLQELVPEWMSEKKSSSGDVLVCINKLASPLTIRSRLEEENKQEMSPLVS